ncbi:OmpA family protein [Nonlabens tegetincola]|uniref:OmpA family protein n=1 Tax=Nonlabens tegetincola TaxID=323273 RepID=UPI0030C7F28B
MLTAFNGQAQFFKKLKKKIDQKVQQTEKKIENKIDKGVDDLLFGNDSVNDASPIVKEESEMVEFKDSMYYDNQSTFKTYSKFDFTPGENLLYFEDFSNVLIGDFPTSWHTNAGTEVVKLEEFNEKWLKIGAGSRTIVISEIANNLQSDFTLEFDFVYDFKMDEYAFKRHFDVILSDLEDPYSYLSKPYKGNFYTYLRIGAGSGGGGKGAILYKKTTSRSTDASTKQPHAVLSNKTAQPYQKHHVSIVKKDTRIKMYINSEKVIDMTQAVQPDVLYQTIRFASNVSPANQHFYISNIKYAGQVEIPTSLFHNDSYQAHGITFQSGSASLNPESYATIKAIAREIENNPENSYQIIGHTDSDGQYDDNITLSRKRAESVYNVLINDFNITPDILSIDGVGDAQPLTNETTATAKAINRRVEIRKI